MKTYYIAWNKLMNCPQLVETDAKKLVERLAELEWLADGILDEWGNVWAWEEAAAYEKMPLGKFIINTWLGHTKYTDPDMCWYKVEQGE